MTRVNDLAALVVAVAGALAAIGAGVRWMIRTLRKVGHLADQLLGEPPQPGLPQGRPGLMERVTAIEKELYPNGGASLRDQVDQLRDQVDRIARVTGADQR